MTLTGHVTNAAGQGDLSGNMFPVDREVDVARCEVIGEIPDGLRGSFIRNGPNPQTSTALQNLVQTFTSSGPEDYDNAVSIQLFEVHILYGCYICIVTLVSE